MFNRELKNTGKQKTINKLLFVKSNILYLITFIK